MMNKHLKEAKYWWKEQGIHLQVRGWGLHEESYRDENEQTTRGRWQTDIAGGSGEAVVRSNEK